jgi:hypothetical protein
LAPFLVLAGWLPFSSGGLRETLIGAMIGYGAVVLGFLGGVRWGAELARAPQAPHLGRLIAAGLQTVPAWVALLIADHAILSLTLLVLAGFAHLNWDIAAARAGLLPAWTARLRFVLTMMGTACLGIAALCVLRLL